jgi:hypothetical protein
MTPDCTGGAACPSIHDTGDAYLVVGAIAGGADVHDAGASVGFGEQAITVPKAVIDAIGQPLQDRIAELEKHLRTAAEGLQAYVEAYGRSPAESDRLWWKTCALVDQIRPGNTDAVADGSNQ